MRASNTHAASVMRRATSTVIEQLEQRRLMSAGDLDSTFAGGVITADLSGGGEDFARGVAVQSSGKVVVLAESGGDFNLIRYNANGTPDGLFGASGSSSINLGDAQLVRAITLQGDSILVAGSVTNATTGSDFAVARYDANGNLDDGFGDMGIKHIDFTDGSVSLQDDAVALAVDNAGRMIVAGQSSAPSGRDISVARLDGSNGAFDNTFDGDGRAHVLTGNGDVRARAVAIDSSNRIVVAGFAFDGTGNDWAVERYTSAGAIDASFGGGDGVSLLNFGAAGDEELADGVAIDASGKIVLGGHTTDTHGSGYATPIVARISGVTGNLDGNFGVNGRVDIPFSSNQLDGSIAAVAIQSDGKIVAGGSAASADSFGVYQAAAARLNSSDGSLDGGFGNGGFTTIALDPSLADGFFASLKIQTDGKIVLAGSAADADNFDSELLLARLEGDGVAPPTNTPPSASNGIASTDEDNSVIIDLKTLTTDNETPSGSLTYAIVATTTHGSLVNNGDGTVTYTPALNYNGSDSFTFKANDGQADSNTATVNLTINAVNDAPTGAGESYSTNEDTTLNVSAGQGVLANDSDVDGDTLTAELYAQTAHGTLSLNADGSFTYTPGVNYNGGDSFQYVVSDGTTTSGPFTASITVNSVNDAPVANADSHTVQNGQTLTVAAPGVLENDSDVDGDTLTAQLASNVSHGTLALNADGSFTYTAASGFTGTDTFTYAANDGHGGSTNAVVSIVVTAAPSQNHPPVADAGPDQKADQNLPVHFNGTGSSDPDGDTLAYTWNFGDGQTGTGATPTHTYTVNGTYNVTLTVNDGHGGISSDVMIVRVLSPQEAVDDIIGQVNALHDSGTLNSGNTNALITKLDGAAAKLTKDDYNAAINKLQAFINQVNGWIGNGKLTSAQGQPLIDSANDLIASIRADQ